MRRPSWARRHSLLWMAVACGGCVGTSILDETATGRQALDDEGLRAVAMARGAREELKEAILGALLYLDDTQIRERPGWYPPTVNACSGDGCLPLTPGTGRALPLPLPPVDNVAGEWANFINIFPDALSLLNNENESVIQIQDSNAFMIAAIAYPLFLFDEGSLPEQQRIVSDLRHRAAETLGVFRRGPGWSFWPPRPGTFSEAPRVGPPNIPMEFGWLNKVVGWLPGDTVPHHQWFDDLFDARLNPFGVDALANVPNDADDTSVAWAISRLEAAFDEGPSPELEPLEEMMRWRDQDRAKNDGRDDWRGPDSGAFLTWLKDEDLPPERQFRSPESGVIPLGVNNVDCVVNANVLFAMGLAGLQDEEAVLATSALLRRAVESRAWPECGLYYPQRMIFPYALSRAYRDAGVDNPDLRAAISRLLLDLLDAQEELARRDPENAGAFPGGADPTLDLSTALGLAALLNIGRSVAEELGRAETYDQAREAAVAFLLRRQQSVAVRFCNTFDRGCAAWLPAWGRHARTWQSGVYFAASNWSLAQWRSEAYTVAMVLESLTKYALARDLEEDSLPDGLRLRVTRYGNNADRAARELSWTVVR